MGHTASLYVFLIRKEPVALTKAVPSNPFCLYRKRSKACALIGPHFLAAEGEAGSSGSLSPDLRDMWRQGCSKSPEWISSCSATEASLGCEVYEHNNERRATATEVTGQDWELGRVALSCRMTLDLLCQEMRDACWDSSESVRSPWSTVTANKKPFSHRGRVVTAEERNVVRKYRQEGV